MSKIRQIAGLALLAVGLLLMHAESLISLVNEARSPKDLGAVSSWCYQPDAVDFKTSNKSGCDVLVIDADDATRAAYSSKSLASVRMNSDGTRRTVWHISTSAKRTRTGRIGVTRGRPTRRPG